MDVLKFKVTVIFRYWRFLCGEELCPKMPSINFKKAYFGTENSVYRMVDLLPVFALVPERLNLNGKLTGVHCTTSIPGVRGIVSEKPGLFVSPKVIQYPCITQKTKSDFGESLALLDDWCIYTRYSSSPFSLGIIWGLNAFYFKNLVLTTLYFISQ